MSNRESIDAFRKKRSEGLQPPKNGVCVRMYRQGLGDCFLLAFPKEDGDPFYMLIDCGVLLGTENQEDVMKKVAEDIAASTGGEIDLLVATHEHWDHLSGFLQAREIFEEKIKVHDLWLAWTEDPSDNLARKLRTRRKENEKALRATAQRLTAAGAQLAAGRVNELLDFFGASGKETTEDALKAVKQYSERAPRYCRPSDAPVTLAGIPGVRIYVLGPPHNEKLIKKSDPTKKGGEVYGLTDSTPNEEMAFFAATLGADSDVKCSYGDLEQRDLTFPFDACHRISPEEAGNHDFFKRQYFGTDKWRTIDMDWLNLATYLALKLDSDTNNTSLVLAIELTASGKVLLFPADAQVGNWESWDDQEWRVNDEHGARTTVTAEDLLARTVLYKVGHHGSHNATLRDLGLERMHSPDLVALIPVNKKMAKKKKWKMPFPPLLERLQEKTHGRILQLDDSLPTKPEGISQAAWKQFERSVSETPAHFTLTIGG
ncbi:MAG TPA: MBL fold metallo-hydrolase [Terriglobales bacterium]|nr:MBL fold metallo-hydrolase [Terriglobales bacterium]